MSQPIIPTLIDLPDELRGKRVLLRPYRVEDAKAFLAAIDESREHLRPWLAWIDSHATIDDTRDYCARCAASWILRTDLTLGVFTAAGNRFLGGTGLHNPNWQLRSFEIGYWLRESAIGHGYMTETVSLLARFALDDLHANRVELSCDVANDASRRVAERSGFLLEGRFRNVLPAPDGAPRDSFVYSLTPADRERIFG